MVKIEVEIPDRYAKFIEVWQRWCGEEVDIAGYIQGSMKSLLEGDYGWVYGKDPEKADELFCLLESGEAAEA
jgi:hypothetical protein